MEQNNMSGHRDPDLHFGCLLPTYILGVYSRPTFWVSTTVKPEEVIQRYALHGLTDRLRG